MVFAAESFRGGTAFPGKIMDILAAEGIRPSTGILVADQSPPVYCCPGEFKGVFLTLERKFLEFHIETEDLKVPKCSVQPLDELVSSHQKGTGKSRGALGIELLDEFFSAAPIKED